MRSLWIFLCLSQVPPSPPLPLFLFFEPFSLCLAEFLLRSSVFLFSFQRGFSPFYHKSEFIVDQKIWSFLNFLLVFKNSKLCGTNHFTPLIAIKSCGTHGLFVLFLFIGSFIDWECICQKPDPFKSQQRKNPQGIKKRSGRNFRFNFLQESCSRDEKPFSTRLAENSICTIFCQTWKTLF